MIITGTRTDSNKIYYKIRTLHKSMMARCYNEKNSSYPRYGGVGVLVRDDWHDLNKFIDTIDKVEGFDLDKLVKGELQLDKDINSTGLGKLYSIDTCKFVTPSENSGNRNNNKECVAISVEGRYYYFKNREEFCRQHNLSSRNVFNCLQGYSKVYKGWQFFYKDSFNPLSVLKPKIIKGVREDGKEFLFNNIAKFAKNNGLGAPNINMVLKGKNATHKGWKFILIEEGFTVQ